MVLMLISKSSGMLHSGTSRMQLGFCLLADEPRVAFPPSGIMAPILLKRAVDALGGVVNQQAVNLTVQALLLSGACRILNALAKEAQGPTFTPVAQAAGRRVAYHTFSHVLDLDINFHLVLAPGPLTAPSHPHRVLLQAARMH